MKPFGKLHQLRISSTPIITTGSRSSRVSIPSSPSIKSCNKPTKIKMELQPIKIEEPPEYQPFILTELNLSDFVFEIHQKQMQNILYGFIDNVNVNIHNLEFANLIRNQIKTLRITIQRLEQQILDATSMLNSMELLLNTQIQMILSLKDI
ncbi:Hypothetical_protein [Hexamita inflata]|uniref:Hypothetical_protein n=1 Tax=Hexamita inflata TaxID=28002 RepID=A0AA86PAE5_9EUKA|nr:Hypothetical protein HINF_LOCUS20725 [Hexamita inflata]CAI9955783.1 Hypothetical protein HINF_LOCUS43428 [Hexamita inflata]